MMGFSLQKFFKELGINAIGIEPARNLIEFAKKRGVKTINDFVSQESTEKAESIIGKPSVIYPIIPSQMLCNTRMSQYT